ncbi:hypothetical protein BK702_10750 [Bacillus thuringiensis serovar cameroun]|nr:hypothetical protein BK702_10750 [Bacillus thuringiensis serovar cameroun]
MPLETNVVINGTDITHTPGSTDITLSSNHTYYVYYSVAGNGLIGTLLGTQLFLDDIGVVGSSTISISNGIDFEQLINTQAVIINTGTTSSILQLRNISGDTRSMGPTTITIIELI